jgi:hypothetical protein
MIINNGDIFDIGQTVNGVSTFIYLNEKIYYFYDDKIQREYEYDKKEIYYSITKDYDGDVKFIGNHLSNLREEKLKELGI